MSSILSTSCDNKCRVCLQDNHKKNLFSLFSPNKNVNNSLTNAELIMLCSAVQILIDDGFPQNMCGNCYNNLSQAYNFKLLCENSDKVLHNQIAVIEPLIQLKTESENRINEQKEEVESITENDDNNDWPAESTSDNNQEADQKPELFICQCLATFKNELFYFTHLNEYCRLRKKTTEKKVRKSKSSKKNSDNAESGDDKQTESDQTCSLCGKIFFRKYNYKRHMETQACTKPRDETKKHLCTHCGRAFKDICNFKAHVRIHTGEKPYVCEFCKKRFAQWSSLQSHRVTHTQEKKYACETCGKAFSRGYVLQRHLSSHSDERKFSCNLCNQKFKCRGSVRRHMVIHTGVKNFKCDFCGKAFHFRKNLVVHRRTHTGDRPYVCEICAQGFSQRYCLRAHMTSQHNIDTQNWQ